MSVYIVYMYINQINVGSVRGTEYERVRVGVGGGTCLLTCKGVVRFVVAFIETVPFSIESLLLFFPLVPVVILSFKKKTSFRKPSISCLT